MPPGSFISLAEETGLEARYLELQITESVMASDVEKSFAPAGYKNFAG
ncbi:hypothetical protein ACIQW9_02350 [Herminiimonas sp. NPDC097707]